MHKSLRKRLNPMIGAHLEYPHFPRRNLVASTKAERLEKRLRELQSYLNDLLTLMTDQGPIKQHVDELDEFLALTEHIKQIRQQNVMKQEDELRAPPPPPEDGAPPPPVAGDEDFDQMQQQMQNEQSHMPMTQEELQQVQFVIQQLWRLIINAQSDVREDYDIQNLLHVVMNMVPRLMASVELGPFTNYQLIPMAEQCLYDLQEVIALYNDEALLYQIGSTGIFDGGANAEQMFGGLGAYGEMADEEMQQ